MLSQRTRLYFAALLTLTVIESRAQNALTLQQALQEARSNNPILRREQFNTDISRSDVITAGLRPNPSLNNQSLQLAQPSNFSDKNSSWYNASYRQIWWQLTRPFQMPVQRQNKIAYAERNVALTEKQYLETERNLFQVVSQKWLDAWFAQKQLDILNTAKSNIDSLVIINRLRLKNQVITTTDLARTELLAGQYAKQTKSAEQAYRNEITGLKFLLGKTDTMSVDTSEAFNVVFPERIDSLLEETIKQRSDIQAIRSGIDVAEANIKLQKSSVLPVPELGLIYNPQNRVQYLGVYGTIEIPLSSRNQGEIRKSKLIREQAEQNLKATTSQAESEILASYQSYQTHKQNLQNFNKLLSQSESILNSVKYSYLRGGTTIIDLLEAQRSWLDTQQQYYNTLQEYRQSYIDLLYASGKINQLAQ